jgi:3alpha(or 20beta)-hydroxysteroid dehydrogenase
LRGLSKSAAFDLVSSGIRVNSVHPGLIDTPLATSDRNAFNNIAAALPMRRGGTVDEIASTVLFLASDEASYITGVDIAVDGGWTTLGVYHSIWANSPLPADDARRLGPS